MKLLNTAEHKVILQVSGMLNCSLFQSFISSRKPAPGNLEHHYRPAMSNQVTLLDWLVTFISEHLILAQSLDVTVEVADNSI